MQLRNRLWGAIPVLAAALIASCATTPEAPTFAEITDEVSVEAIILSVDKTSRELTLRRPDGTSVVVVAGPEVRNFDQIEAGNKVSARYTVSLSARRLAPEEPSPQPTAGVAAARAEPGEMPGAAIGAGVAVTVVVKSVDLEQNVVVLTDPEGAIHAVEAEREEGQRFIAGLKPGDRVELVYKAALVLAVE
jgi:hypothetical protein